MPRRAMSGTKVSRLRAKGVAAFEPCGENKSLTGSLAAGGEAEAGGEILSYSDKKKHRDEQNPEFSCQCCKARGIDRSCLQTQSRVSITNSGVGDSCTDTSRRPSHLGSKLLICQSLGWSIGKRKRTTYNSIV